MGSLGTPRSHPASKSKHNNVPQVTNYKYTCMAKVQDAKKPIYDVKFNLTLKKGQPDIFATAGADRVSIFECDPDGALRVLQVFSDPKDSFFTCAWTTSPQDAPLLVAAGRKGVIRLLSPGQGACIYGIAGHTQSINDTLIHPRHPGLLFTASKDHSIRLWNIYDNILVAIFGGSEGHRDEVISLDINIDANRLLSGGMDHSIKVWNLNKPEIEDAIRRSECYNPIAVKPFHTYREHFPHFSTRKIHGDYVDCVRWFGDLIISKSCSNNRIRIWKGGWPLQNWNDLKLTDSECSVLATFTIENCSLWYVRFCLDSQKSRLALGNAQGQIFVYELGDDCVGYKVPGIILRNPQCTQVIRQTAFSRDGRLIVAVCDDGTVWRWDSTNRKRNVDFY